MLFAVEKQNFYSKKNFFFDNYETKPLNYSQYNGPIDAFSSGLG
jgi:hypothetical protein